MADKRSTNKLVFNYSNFNWTEYEAHRPKYTKALYDIVFQYHESTGGAYDTALDLGAGIGIVTKELLPLFKHVTLSDPYDGYILQARSHFGGVDAGKLDFLLRKGEDIRREDLSHGPLDLIAAGSSLHWTDLKTSVPNLAKVLRPGGTLAAWSYAIQAVVGGDANPGVEAALKMLIDKVCLIYDGIVPQKDEEGTFAVMNARLDCADFDPAVWRDVQRIHAHRGLNLVSNDPRWPVAKSKVRPEETVKDFEDQGIMSLELDYDGVIGWLASMNPEKFIPSALPDEMAAIKDALAGGKMRLEFAAVLVLATKREKKHRHSRSASLAWLKSFLKRSG